ncbi:MAG TPA: CHAT domain-containing protein [Thermoanaerobaculia bacterium]|jgi:CHAT domain-containing protein/Tfp pilus assembly protein PilF|nr:CHAT domain-containing protein [Thermoanaerobaculia bacterium]
MERKGLACLLFLALAGLGLARAEEEAVLLQVGVPVSRELHGEAHLYRLPMKAGDYARVEVTQQGVDAIVVVSNPAGGVLVKADLFGRYSTEVASFVAETAGEYGIAVQPFSRSALGTYRLTLTTLHPEDPEDRLQIEAERSDQAAESDLDSARLAVQLRRELGDRPGEAWALTRLGRRQNRSHQYQEGLASCEQALELHRLTGERQGIAESLTQIGVAKGNLNDRSGALAAYQEAIALWQELGQPESVARALVYLGRTYTALDDDTSALAVYEQALPISRKAKDFSWEAHALNDLGQIHIRLGEPQKAMHELRDALDLARATENRFLETDVRHNLGALYQESSPREALEQFDASARIFQETGQTDKQCSALINLGGLLLQLGAPEEAREHYGRALALCREPDNRAYSLLGLGRAEDQLGNLKEAEARLDEAQQIQESVAHRAGEAETLRVRGFLLLKLGKPAQARQTFVEALGLMEQLGGRSTEIAARRGLARAEEDLGNLDLARKGFEEARKQAEEMGKVSEQALALAEAGRLEHEAGKLPEARALLDSALRLAETFQSEISGESLRAQHFAKIRETYERYVDVLMQLHRTTPDAGLLEMAFEAAEHSRARSLLDVLTRARVDTRESDPELRERELQLRLELNAKAAIRMNLPPGPEKEAIDREIRGLTADYHSVEARLAGSYLELSQPSIRVPDVQALLDDGTALFEYLLGDTRSYLWVVTRDSVTPYELPARSKIEEMARQAHQLLSSPSERDPLPQRRALDELSRTVIAPAVKGLAGKRLVIVADGALQYIPFAALPIDPGTLSTQPLVTEHETVLLPSAAVLGQIRLASKARPPSPRSLTIFADPSYGTSGPTPPSLPSLLPDTTRGGLAPLTWSRREAEQIALLADKYAVMTAIGPAATRELALSDKVARSSILHFATHGLLDGDHPELSGLALASVDKDGHPLEGFLRLQDLYSLHLQCELVVLSGCETGLGRDLRGEGLQSLTHGFLHAGASQVIASLWPVRDRAATEFMLRLYRAVLRDGKRPSAALREAQLGMLSQHNSHDPYFWAAFVAQGDWLAGPDMDTADRVDTLPTR